MAWLSFIELDKAVVLWSDWLVIFDYGFSVSAFWCPLETPTILLGFILPWMWGISSLLPQQSAAAASYLGQGVSSHGCPSWPWTWSSASLGPPVPAQPPLLGGGVALLQQGPWPPEWGSSSRPPPLTLHVGKLLSAAAPALSQPGTLRRFLLPWARGSSILQYVSISNQHVDILNYTMLYVSYISIKLRKIKIKAEKRTFHTYTKI